MPAPEVCAVRVPFFYKAPELPDDAMADSPTCPPTDGTLVTYVTIEVLAFGGRFFWLHVSESESTRQVPRLGCCSVSVGLSPGSNGSGRPALATSQLMEFEAARQQDMTAGTNTSVQSVFASSLSERLVRGLGKRVGAPATVYVNCAIEGERCTALLGTDGGSGFEMTHQFGALVYREALAVLVKLMQEHEAMQQ